MALSDEVVIMNKGAIEQRGAPLAVYQQPATLFAARFLGCSNHFKGRVIQAGDGMVSVEVEPDLRLLGRWRDPARPVIGEAVEAVFRPDIVVHAGPEQDAANVIEGGILTAGFLGHSIDYSIAVGGFRIRAEMSPDTIMSAGDSARLYIPPHHIHVFRPDPGSTT
jgi:ABC-type Fe3+/spermidine/putrescine transport system ATPase subunit